MKGEDVEEKTVEEKGLPEAEGGFWMIVELFGHQRIAGKVSEFAFGGGTFVRVDVPEVGELKGFTRFFGEKAIYSMSPVTEEIARRLVAAWRVVPIRPFGLTLPAIGHEDDE